MITSLGKLLMSCDFVHVIIGVKIMNCCKLFCVHSSIELIKWDDVTCLRWTECGATRRTAPSFHHQRFIGTASPWFNMRNPLALEGIMSSPYPGIYQAPDLWTIPLALTRVSFGRMWTLQYHKIFIYLIWSHVIIF